VSQNVYSKVQTQNAKLKPAKPQFQTAFIDMRRNEILRILKNFKNLVKFVNFYEFYNGRPRIEFSIYDRHFARGHLLVKVQTPLNQYGELKM